MCVCKPVWVCACMRVCVHVYEGQSLVLNVFFNFTFLLTGSGSLPEPRAHWWSCLAIQSALASPDCLPSIRIISNLQFESNEEQHILLHVDTSPQRKHIINSQFLYLDFRFHVVLTSLRFSSNCAPSQINNFSFYFPRDNHQLTSTISLFFPYTGINTVFYDTHCRLMSLHY